MALCTKEQVKIHIFGSSTLTTYDTLLDQLITQVEEKIKHETGIVTVDSTDYLDVDDEIINSTGCTRQYSKYRPLRTLDAIYTRNSSWDWTEYTQEDHDDMELDDDRFFSQYVIDGKGRRNIKTDYTCGYKTAEVPADLNLLTILLVVGIYNQRQSIGFDTMNVLGFNVALSSADHFLVKDLLAKYSKIYAL